MPLDFETAYAWYRHHIDVVALGQFVPGLDHDDVVSEMTICLWKAAETWERDTKMSFLSYWWSVWLNRRSDLASLHYAAKRPRAVPVAEPRDTTYEIDLPPEPPRGSSRTEELIWLLLSNGEPVKDVIQMAEVSRRGYYNVVESWRTDDIWDQLT